MKLSICQLNICYEDMECNLERAEVFIKRAAKEGAELILFPEMSFTGFSMNIKLTGIKDDYLQNRMSFLAVKYNLNIGYGWVHLKDIKAENHYTIVSSRGDVISDYIKIHSFTLGGENQYFTPGSRIKYFEMRGMVLATFVCYDLRFPEIFQIASRKADIIIIAANWPAVRKEHWSCLLKARAIENQCYVVGINCVGEQNGIVYSGNSTVIKPDGESIFNIDTKEEMTILDIENDVKKYREKFPFKSDRRSDLYIKLYERR